MIIKNLILIFLMYMAYRIIKRMLLEQDNRNKDYPVGKRDDQSADVMIKDPECGVYFPQREGISLRVDGETLYFCSEKCRDEYKKKM
jgi:YHS domain-containing protein